MSEEVNWQQLAEGFRLERNIMQEMAMKAQAKVEHCEKVHQNDLMHMVEHARRNREAGRREGLEEAAQKADQWAISLSRDRRDSNPRHVRTAAGIAYEIRKLIDSPRAEGEEPDE